MSKCLFCYQELENGQVDYHPACARKFFGSDTAPILPYTRDNMSELARQVIRTSASVTGVQAKMSLDVTRGGKNEPAKFTIVGLWGKYIFKPQSGRYRCLPELDVESGTGNVPAMHVPCERLDKGFVTRHDSKGRMCLHLSGTERMAVTVGIVVLHIQQHAVRLGVLLEDGSGFFEYIAVYPVVAVKKSHESPPAVLQCFVACHGLS